MTRLFAALAAVATLAGNVWAHIEVDMPTFEDHSSALSLLQSAALLQTRGGHIGNESMPEVLVNPVVTRPIQLGLMTIEIEHSSSVTKRQVAQEVVNGIVDLCRNPVIGFQAVLVTVGPVSGVLLAILLATAAMVYSWEDDQPLVREKSAEIATETEVAEIDNSATSNDDVEAPIWLYRAVVIGNAMLMTNFTVIMPASGVVSKDHGDGEAFSGWIIGIYALGSIASLPAMLWFSTNSYRSAMLLMAFTGLLGNLIYAIAAAVPGTLGTVMLLVARFICGLEGGTACVFQNALIRCSGRRARIIALADMVAGSSSGLIIGPFLSSLSRTAAAFLLPNLSIALRTESVPAAVMVVAAIMYGIMVMTLVPPQEECCMIDDKDQLPRDMKPDKSYDSSYLKTSWLAMVLCCVMQTLRYFQRVFWEAAGLFILSKGYGFGSVAAGYIVAVTLLPLLLIPQLSGAFLARLGFSRYSFMLECMQFVGLLLMVRIEDEASPVSLVLFLIGSSFYCVGNWGQGVAYTVFRAQFPVANHWCLSVENGTGISWFCTFVGYFLGPICSRYILAQCMFQDLVPASLMMTLLIFLAGQKVIMMGIDRYGYDH